MKKSLFFIASIMVLFVFSCTCKKRKKQIINTETKSTESHQKQISRTINRKLTIPRDSLLKNNEHFKKEK